MKRLFHIARKLQLQRRRLAPLRIINLDLGSLGRLAIDAIENCFSRRHPGPMVRLAGGVESAEGVRKGREPDVDVCLDPLAQNLNQAGLASRGATLATILYAAEAHLSPYRLVGVREAGIAALKAKRTAWLPVAPWSSATVLAC